MSKDVFVTGLGMVSAIGQNVEETLVSLQELKTGLGNVHHLRTIHRNLPCGEVSLSDVALREILQIPADEEITRTSLLGILAAKEAYLSAEVGRCKTLGLRIGFLNGTTVGGMERSEQYYLDFINPESNEYTAYINAHDCGYTTEKIADYLDKFDFVSTISTACSSAVNTLIHAVNMLQAGYIDCVIAGGSECLTKFHLNGFRTLMILDEQPCRPFDETRAGLNLGEGAAYLVLETEKSLKLRNRKAICKITGWGNSCDAYHQTASSPNGKGAVLSMNAALSMANLKPQDIDYINAHGTGTPNNDESEGMAIMEVFKEKIPPISSTKSYTGHTTSASGSVEAVISILAMKHGFLPVNLNFKHPMSQLSFSPIYKMHKNGNIKHVLNNSFGFGGNNSSIIFSTL